MNILLIAATKLEIAPLLKKASLPDNVQFPLTLHFGANKVDILISSPGITACTYHLTRYLQNNDCDLAINAGIAGSFDKNLAIGDLVVVGEEVFGDLGIDNRGEFCSLFDENLIPNDQFPFHGGWLQNPHSSNLTNGIPVKKGVTVNTSSGSEERIRTIKDKFQPDIESMEGAAFFYTCLLENISFIELRAISNYVEPRNKPEWNIQLAVENLNTALFRLFDISK